MELQKEYAAVFRALGDETRLKIIEILSGGEMCACDILSSFDISQPTLSYHMKILTECGIVTCRKEGAWINYNLNDEVLSSLKQFWNLAIKEHKKCSCKLSRKTSL